MCGARGEVICGAMYGACGDCVRADVVGARSNVGITWYVGVKVLGGEVKVACCGGGLV